MSRVKVTLIGGGKIACGKNLFASNVPMSHLEGIISSSNAVAHAVVEPDKIKIASIKHDWDNEVVICPTLREVPLVPDEVIVICSPSESHYGCVLEALERRPIAIIVEKPLCLKLEHAKDITQRSKFFEVPIYINFNRRFDPRFNKLSTMVPKNPIAIHVDYTRGISNYASHFIDLILQWYGSCSSVRQVGNFDSSLSDPNPSFFLNFESGFIAYFKGFDDIDYDLLDMTIWHKSGAIKLSAGGAVISVEKPVTDLFYNTYDHLGKVWNSSGQVSGFRELYELICSEKLYDSSVKACDLSTGALNVEIIDAVFCSSEQRGDPVFLNVS